MRRRTTYAPVVSFGNSTRTARGYRHDVTSRSAEWWETTRGGTARDRLLASAETCFERFGLEKTNVEDVASEAGVSRATVYRHFPGGRDEVVLGVLLGHAQAFLSSLARRLERQPTIVEAIVQGVLETLAAANEDPSLAQLFSPTAASHTASLAGRSAALFDLAAEHLGPLFERAQEEGRLRPGVEPAGATEFVVRMILSLLAVPDAHPRSAAARREFVRVYCAGALLTG